ncbi:MAG: glycerol-3-phosphate acyltransferase [Chloroflexi bacterium]|nr:glycerol-3-phosphate acyltransferase [Chloroflexota bacterium]
MWYSVLLIIGSYFLGAIPLQYYIGRLKGYDLHNEYDLHISLWRKVGPKYGIFGITGDILKGMIPVIIGNLLNFEPFIVGLAGLAAVIGQMWPVFFKFDGEKGNTTGIGMILALTPRSFLLFVIPVGLGALIRTLPRLFGKNKIQGNRLKFGGPPSNSLPIGMVISFGLYPLTTTALFNRWFDYSFSITMIGIALFLLIEIRRMTAGLKADLKLAEGKKQSKNSIVVNRLILDRGFR